MSELGTDKPKKACFCKTNNTSTMVQCKKSRCDSWSHYKCVGLSDAEEENKIPWYCRHCDTFNNHPNTSIEELNAEMHKLKVKVEKNQESTDTILVEVNSIKEVAKEQLALCKEKLTSDEKTEKED